MQKTNNGERRLVSRVNFDAQAVIAQRNRTYAATLLDISVKGLLAKVEQAEAIEDGQATLIMELADNSQIIMAISLIHRQGNELGFRCDSIDVESAAHLRRLMELNLDGPDAAERVLEEMLSAPIVPKPEST